MPFFKLKLKLKCLLLNRAPDLFVLLRHDFLEGRRVFGEHLDVVLSLDELAQVLVEGLHEALHGEYDRHVFLVQLLPDLPERGVVHLKLPRIPRRPVTSGEVTPAILSSEWTSNYIW